MTKSKKAKIVISWLLTIILMGVIFYLSAQTATESADLSGSVMLKIIEFFHISPSAFLVRKAAHASEFFLLAILFSNAFYQTKGKPLSLVSLALTIVYACTDEFHQRFVEGRACAIFDVGVDSSGALIGILICYIIFKIYIFKKQKREADV